MIVNKEEIGEAILYCGDCRDIIPDLSVDAVITDPPYGIDKAKSSLVGGSKGDYDTNLFMDTQENLINNIVPAFLEAKEIATRAIITPGQINIYRYPEPDHMGVYYYPASCSISRWGGRLWQPILYYGKDPHQGKLLPDSKVANDSDRTTDHPCPKPINSWTWLVNRTSLPNETILDPFMGSGTTGVACANLGRKFIGIELEPKYFYIACERIEAAYAQGRLFA